MKYTVGFLFDETFEHVLLIKKNRPAWQAGMLNGIGGKVEEFDLSNWYAQAREFFEETGLRIAADRWRKIAKMVSKNHEDAVDKFSVDVFYAVAPLSYMQEFRSTTDEVVVLHAITYLSLIAEESGLLPNVPLLIALARTPEARSGRLQPVRLEYV